MSDHENGRPWQGGHMSSTAINDNTSLPPASLIHPRAVAPAYVVATFSDDGTVRRRQVYLSLHSALKAQERAEAKGARFEMLLCELVPTSSKPVIVVGGEDR